MLGSLFLGFYFSSLVSFSFVSHSIVYCVLLLLSALGVSGYSFYLLGFSWYLLLFCLVYVGGVYVLFIFISVHAPNQSSGVGWSFLLFFALFFSFFLLFWSWDVVGYFLDEHSHYLCSYFEGVSYCIFCLILMFGFICVSFVVSGKDSFFR